MKNEENKEKNEKNIEIKTENEKEEVPIEYENLHFLRI